MKQSYLIFFISLAMFSCEGPEGAVGPQGIQGIAGENGTDGINGMNGINGSDGANGANGADGATGPQGPAGPPGFANVERIEKVLKFSESSKISDWHRYWVFTDDKITDDIIQNGFILGYKVTAHNEIPNLNYYSPMPHTSFYIVERNTSNQVIDTFYYNTGKNIFVERQLLTHNNSTFVVDDTYYTYHFILVSPNSTLGKIGIEQGEEALKEYYSKNYLQNNHNYKPIK